MNVYSQDLRDKAMEIISSNDVKLGVVMMFIKMEHFQKVLHMNNLVGDVAPNQCHNMLGSYFDGSIWGGYGGLSKIK